MREQNEGPAELAAQVGTIEACWVGYLQGVVLATFNLVGMPPNKAEYLHGAKLDYYAGAAAVFQILREKYKRGDSPTGRIMIELEQEVAAFLVAQQPRADH